ncbi:MAG: CHAT domain-containing tetratricopeptide repeat protein [Bacteroidia bacterium]
MKNLSIIIFFICIMSLNEAYSQLWKQYVDSANAYNIKKDNDKSIEFYTKANEELKKDSAVTITYAGICDSLGVLYYKTRQYKEAEKFYIEAKLIKEKVIGREHPEYISSCDFLAALYKNMEQFEKAEPLYIEAKKIREKVYGNEHSDYARSCLNLANFYRATVKYDKAEPLYLEAKQILEKVFGKEHPEYAGSCDNLASLYWYMGQYDRAEKLYLEAKQIREKFYGKEHLDYAKSCNNLALVYMELGQYEKSELLYIEAKQTRAKLLGKENREYASSCDNLANLYYSMGQYAKAEPLYIEAIQIRKKVLGSEHSDYAASCNNLANLYKDIGQYDKAEPLYLESKQILQKVFGKEHPYYTGSCINLADLYRHIGEYKKAESALIQARQIKAKTLGIENPDYARSCYILADLYLEMDEFQKAELLILESKEIFGTVLGKQHLDYGLSCANLARLYWLKHQQLKAEEMFKESFFVKAYNLKAIFLFTNEKEKTAFIKNKLGQGDIPYSFYVSGKLKSEQPYSLSLFHRNLILSSSQAVKNQLLSSNDTTLSNKYYEWINLKKHLSVLYSKPINERKEDVAKIEENANQLEKELTRLSSSFKKQQQQADWKDIQNKLQADEASIEFASFQYYNSKRYTDTTLYIAIVLRKDMLLPATISLFNEKQLTDLLSVNSSKTNNEGINWLYTQSGSGENSNLAANKSLYDLIWKPLEKELKGIKTVYFAPAGLLHRIAFAALPVSNKEVLSDKYKLVQLATTASVTDQQPYYVSASDKLQLYGGINYDADSTALKNMVISHPIANNNSRSLPSDLTRGEIWKELPGTQEEINGIKNESSSNYTVSLLSGINATEESMKALDGKNAPVVLHIASHGFFFPDPKDIKTDTSQKFTSGKVFKQSDDPLFRSGILFAGANNAWSGKPIEGIEDGILTAYEVSNMYLPNTKLVVLSACETALGDIQGSEGVYGLQRAFKMAGAQNLVMSLWKVPDAETAEFMQLFYKNLFAKKTISNAFYDAQQVMKNKFRNEPYKWAAWVLVR